MRFLNRPRTVQIAALLLLVAGLLLTGTSFAADAHTTTVFKGVKVNAGTVTHSRQDGKNVLTLSDDFKVPDTPDPHWQVVDSEGRVYQLDRLQAKNGKYNKSIVLPAYVPDVVKVQIWCAFAEILLGEASFSAPVM
jgi:hypothetical protein